MRGETWVFGCSHPGRLFRKVSHDPSQRRGVRRWHEAIGIIIAGMEERGAVAY